MKKIITALLFIFMPLIFTQSVSALDATITIHGDTALGENQPGWLFNRDISTSTPYEFNTDAFSLGIGSLYVEPISANASDKFIAENFINTPIANIDSISYDFKIGSGGEEADSNHFYFNVYANFGVSDDLKFYDCRYNIVPTTGSTTNFTTVTFDPNESYSVTTRFDAPFDCPSTPADMDLDSAGSNVRVFAINVGDTSVNDLGLNGYLDNVIVDLDTDTTTFDFEPVIRSASITSPVTDQFPGMVDFEAYLVDNDVDAIQWAVRSGTCATGTGTVFGNVDGHSDVATINSTDLLNQTFSFTGDMTGMEPGMYCFVYNPTEDSGETGIRLTQEFELVAPPVVVPTTKDECKKDGWMSFSNPSFKNQGQCVSYVMSNDN